MKRLASRTLFHGTSDVFMDSIKENGLTPGNNNGNSNSKDSDSNSVYVTSEYQEAADFAKVTASEQGGNPIVLYLNIDESLLTPDDNILKYDIKDYDTTLELTGYTEDELKKWTGITREDNSMFYVPLEGMYDDDPIPYTPNEEPFIGGDIFDILEMDLAKYPQAILPSEIIKIEKALQ